LQISDHQPQPSDYRTRFSPTVHAVSLLALRLPAWIAPGRGSPSQPDFERIIFSLEQSHGIGVRANAPLQIMPPDSSSLVFGIFVGH
jgi:hypothetical protein